jgi:hypothetical protein
MIGTHVVQARVPALLGFLSKNTGLFQLFALSRFCVSKEEIQCLGSFAPGKGLYRLSFAYCNVSLFLKLTWNQTDMDGLSAVPLVFHTHISTYGAAEAEFLEEIQTKV